MHNAMHMHSAMQDYFAFFFLWPFQRALAALRATSRLIAVPFPAFPPRRPRAAACLLVIARYYAMGSAFRTNSSNLADDPAINVNLSTTPSTSRGAISM